MHLKTYVTILIVAVYINEVTLLRSVGLGTLKRRVLNPWIRRGGRPLRRSIRRVNIGSILREQKGLHRNHWDRFTRDPQFLVQLPKLSYLCESIQVMHGRAQQRRSKQFDMWTARQLHIPRARLPSIRLAMDLLCRKITSLPTRATTKKPKSTTATRKTPSTKKATSRKPPVIKTTQSSLERRCFFTHHTKPGNTKQKIPNFKHNISKKVYGSTTKATTPNHVLTSYKMIERSKTSQNPGITSYKPTASSETTQSFENITHETFGESKTTHKPETTICETTGISETTQITDTTTYETTGTSKTTQQTETTTYETTGTSETTQQTEATTYETTGTSERIQQTETTTYETTGTSETTQQTETTTYETTGTSERTENTETTTYETTVTNEITQDTETMTYKDMISETTQSSGITIYKTSGTSKTTQKPKTVNAKKGISETTRNSDTPTRKPVTSPKPSQTLNDTKHTPESKKNFEPHSVTEFTAGGTLIRSSTFEPKGFQEPEQEILEDGEISSNPSVSRSQKNFTSKLLPTTQSTTEPQQDIFSPTKSIELDLSNEQISPELEKENRNETSTELGGILLQSHSPVTSSTVKTNWKKDNINKKLHKFYNLSKLEVMNKYAIAHIIKSLGVKGGNLKFTKTYLSKLLNAVR